MTSDWIRYSAALRWIACCLLCGALACSGGSSTAPPPGAASRPAGSSDQTEADKERQRQEALAQLNLRQEAACDRVGDEMLRCAIEDLKANKTPEEIAKLDLEQTGPVFRQRFVDSCVEKPMSLRQVKVYETCVEGDTECDALHTCLDQAKPRPR